MRRSIVLSLLCLPTMLLAQQADHIISPGMSRAQVVAALGAPATQRTASEFTYMFYPNSCGRECGMNDLVILRHDSVSDAIFRSPNRHYTGTSSSPEQATPALAPRRPRPATRPMTTHDTTAKPKATAAKAERTKAATTQLKPPATANDAKPSIPTKTTPMPPAPAKTPAKAPATTPTKAPAPDKKPG